ncbi:hypothetical protein JVU11DRAFT_2147 [Chiua virens]|nr:hypothetical protein JVU11DRAFT_2147 [Chiua virens]
MLSRRYGGEMIAFFAAGAKASVITVPLEGHLPQVILKLVACAKHLGRSHIRGALTTGIKWHFVVVDLNADSDGAKSWVSELIEWKWKTKRGPISRERLVEETSDESDPALIAGILSSWIPESFVEFDGDQWFVQQPAEMVCDGAIASDNFFELALSHEQAFSSTVEEKEGARKSLWTGD